MALVATLTVMQQARDSNPAPPHLMANFVSFYLGWRVDRHSTVAGLSMAAEITKLYQTPKNI
jgi:hypothetical protein